MGCGVGYLVSYLTMLVLLLVLLSVCCLVWLATGRVGWLLFVVGVLICLFGYCCGCCVR